MNGWGYAWGTLSGMGLSLVALFRTDVPAYWIFPAIAGLSLVVSIMVSLSTAPVDRSVLESFYRGVRPFGMWAPIRDRMDRETPPERGESAAVGIFNVLLGMVAISGLYLFPMYLVGHWYRLSAVCLSAAAAAGFGLWFTWYRCLPPARPADKNRQNGRR